MFTNPTPSQKTATNTMASSGHLEAPNFTARTENLSTTNQDRNRQSVRGSGGAWEAGSTCGAISLNRHGPIFFGKTCAPLRRLKLTLKPSVMYAQDLSEEALFEVESPVIARAVRYFERQFNGVLGFETEPKPPRGLRRGTKGSRGCTSERFCEPLCPRS